MRKKILIFTLIMLFLLPVLYSPENPTLSVDTPAIGNSLQVQEDFVISADGDVSKESIGESYSQKWRETLDSDTMLYPDRLQPDGASELTSYEICDNFVDTSNFAIATDTTDNSEFSSDGDLLLLGAECTTSQTGLIKIKWTLGASYGANGWNVLVRYRFNTTSESAKWQGYISFDSGVGSIFFTETTDWTVSTTSLTGSTTAVNIVLQFLGSNPTVSVGLFVDWFIVTGETAIPDYNDGEGDTYEDNFAGVSDWTTSDTSISTDGDLATITENGAGSTGRAYASFTSIDYFEYYYEFQISTMTATTTNLEFWDGSAYNTLHTFTTAGTYKGIISDADAATMQRIGFLVGSNGGNIKPDYLRISPSDESGWQHDCSTTSGVGDNGNTKYDYHSSSDGDILNLTSVRNNATASDPSGDFYIYYDTTSTKTDLSISYYPFFELKYNIPTSNSWLYVYAGGKMVTGYTLTADSQWHTLRLNIEAGAGTGLSYVRFVTDYTYALDSVGTILIDWVGFNSIANFTVTQSSTTTDDYLYVSGGTLYSHVDSGYIEANHDPALSVSDTYPVYNLSTSGTAPEFSQYVSSWSSYSDDTRGATTSGTVTDIKLKFDSTEIISEIKFIEDSTKPDIIRANMAPTDSSDDEEITLSAVATDAVEVYKLWFDAITYPAGFSDVEYYATEISDNLWTYSFSSMTQGYYVFKVLATDGANENDLDYYSYIEFTVRESEITIDEISFFGVGEDFTMMTFSFKINKDCTYVINEASANIGASDTHSGSVSEGTVNMAWDKLTTTDDIVNFTITFTNGTDTKTMDGQYQVAQTVLSVSAYDWGLSETQVTLSYQTTKAGTYTFYRDDVQISTDSFIKGSNVYNWSRPSSTDPSMIRAAMKLADTTSTIWLNQTYDEFSVDALSILVFIFEKDYPNISIFVNTNWGNCTLYVYENDVLMDSGTEGTLSYSKCTNLCTSRVGVKTDGGGSIVWGNFTYTGTPENLTITAMSFNTFGEYITAFTTTNWLNCTLSLSEKPNGGSYVLMSEEPEGETVRYLKSTTPGNYMVKLRIEGGTDEKNIEFSYTVAVTYGTSTINAFLSSGEGITDLPSKFKLYVNGSRIGDNSFYNDTSASYEICVKDYYDNEIYNATHSWATNIDLSLVFHTLKIYSQIQNDPIYFVLTRGGSTISEYIGIGEIIKYYLASGTYTYTFTQGGQIYTDDLILTDDSYYTVTDLDLWDIMNKPDNAGGGTDFYSILSWYGIVGLFGIMFIGQIPKIGGFILSLFSRPKKKKRSMR